MNDKGKEREMCGSWCTQAAKLVGIASFLVLLSTTYYLRTEVLELNEIRFSADEARAEYEMEGLAKDHPHQLERYKVEMQNFELQTKHYQEMLALYESDYESYAERLKDEYEPPQLPFQPSPPKPPEYTRKLSEINARFRAQKHHYFEATSSLNWIAWAAAVGLVGALLWLIMFDTARGRLIYFMMLVLSFVFMIGPAFHSILSAIVGFLEAPSMY